MKIAPKVSHIGSGIQLQEKNASKKRSKKITVQELKGIYENLQRKAIQQRHVEQLKKLQKAQTVEFLHFEQYWEQKIQNLQKQVGKLPSSLSSLINKDQKQFTKKVEELQSKIVLQIKKEQNLQLQSSELENHLPLNKKSRLQQEKQYQQQNRQMNILSALKIMANQKSIEREKILLKYKTVKNQLLDIHQKQFRELMLKNQKLKIYYDQLQLL